MREALAAGDRRRALGFIGGSTIGQAVAGHRPDHRRRPRRRPRGRPRRGGPRLRPRHLPPRLPGDHEVRVRRRRQGMSTKAPDLARRRPLPRDPGRAGRDPRQRGQERRTSSPRTSSSSTRGSTSHLGGIDFSINKAVFYLLLGERADDRRDDLGRQPDAAGAEQGPDGGRARLRPHPQQHHRGNIPDEKLARRWFPFLATLFFFIWFSNMIGFLPLPINTEHKVDVLGLEVPVASRSTRRPRTSRSRSSSRSSSGSATTSRASGRRASSSTSRAGCRPASRT